MTIRYTWPVILWSAIILTVTLIPGKAVPEVDIVNIDKVVHFFIFAVLMVATSYAVKKTRDKKGLPTSLLLPGLYSIGLGISIEFLQRYVPGRSFSVADMIANTIGVAIGYFIFKLMVRKNMI